MNEDNAAPGLRHFTLGGIGAYFLMIASVVNASDATLSGQQKDSLLDAIEAVQAAEGLVGVQVAVFYGGGLAFSMHSGYADLEHQVRVTAQTRFEVASITKAFTGLALLQLHQQGGIDVDAPIQRYVPDFPDKPEGTITPRLLAGGLGGIRHYNEKERTPEYYATHYDNVADAIEIFKSDPLVVKPGERVVYSSYGYNLLAAAIQGATGTRYQDYVHDTIINPMGLMNTGQVDVRFPMTNRARTYGFIDPYTREVSDRLLVLPTMEHSYNAGGGNMYSTAQDLATFGSNFMTPGFLSEQIYEQVYTPHKTHAGEYTWFSDGWVLIALAANPRSLIAGGSYPGVQAMLRVYPDEALVIALVTNTWGKNGADGAFLDELPDQIEKIVLSAAE